MRLLHALVVIALLLAVSACTGPTGSTGAQGEQGTQGPPGAKGEDGAPSTASVGELADAILANPDLVNAIVAKIAEDEALVERLRGEPGAEGVCDCGDGGNNGAGEIMTCQFGCDQPQDCPDPERYACEDGACRYLGCGDDSGCAPGQVCR